MKTQREILWQRYQSVEPKLDAVRHEALASLLMNLGGARVPSSPDLLMRSAMSGLDGLASQALQVRGPEETFASRNAVSPHRAGAQGAIENRVVLTPARTPLQEKVPSGIREMLLSLRWHVAGMSAAWVLVALLNIDHSPSPVAAMSKERIPSPQQLLAALRENRRQIAELLESPANVSEPSLVLPSFVPKRRGEIQSTNSMAYSG